MPITDLSILGKFFKNEHVKAEERQAGKSVQRHAISFYSDAKEAEDVLGNYLADPPQLADTRRYVVSREIEFPLESPEFGKLLHELYSVKIDVDEMRMLYGF